MKRSRRDNLLLTLLLLTLAGALLALAIAQAQRQPVPALSSKSNAPTGGRALRLWLEALDYKIIEVSGTRPRVPAAELGLILEPEQQEGNWSLPGLSDWLSKGGTLIIAGHSWGAQQAMQQYDFSLAYLTQPAAMYPTTPLLMTPPLPQEGELLTEAYLETERSDYVVLMAVDGKPVIVSFQKGAGRVILSASPYPFYNRSLKQPGYPELVLNLLSGAKTRRVWFDEWHHGEQIVAEDTSEVPIVGFENWLSRTPPGRALLAGLAIGFIALLLWGRPFGRPLTPARHSARRAPLEYINALAQLSRRAGHRRATLGYYHRRLKRELGRRYRLDPSLSDDAYVAELARMRPGLDAPALLDLLQRLQRKDFNERELVQWAAEAADWMKK